MPISRNAAIFSWPKLSRCLTNQNLKFYFGNHVSCILWAKEGDHLALYQHIV